jgi:hypothetical protein
MTIRIATTIKSAIRKTPFYDLLFFLLNDTTIPAITATATNPGTNPAPRAPVVIKVQI